MHDLRARGFSLLTRGPVGSAICRKFEHVTLERDPSVPAFDYGEIGERLLTFVLDETGEAWSADGHVALDDLCITRTERIPF